MKLIRKHENTYALGVVDVLGVCDTNLSSCGGGNSWSNFAIAMVLA